MKNNIQLPIKIQLEFHKEILVLFQMSIRTIFQIEFDQDDWANIYH